MPTPISPSLRTAAVGLAAVALAPTCLAIDQTQRERAHDMIGRATSYLLAQQHESGGWAIPEDPAAPTFPAITGLVLNALALHPDEAPTAPAAEDRDAAARRAIDFILHAAQPDGGIYLEMLPSYNTAICISALSRWRDQDPRLDPVIQDAVEFLRALQWGHPAPPANPDGSRSPAADTVREVPPDHPFYGGIGYGRHGRPDNSNLNLAMEAFHDAGIDRDDPAFQRALVFLQRTQMHESVNDAPYAAGSTQGGFIYATAETGSDPGAGQSQAGVIEETLDDGSTISRLRAYGSMTYAAFKTMIYAGLSPDDPRVRLALDWIERNYTVAENPGIGAAGYYYYILTFARALDAADIRTIAARGDSPGSAEPDGAPRDWATDLIDHLATLQNEDGSFRSIDARWMEDNPVLITAYAMLALEHAAGLADARENRPPRP